MQTHMYIVYYVHVHVYEAWRCMTYVWCAVYTYSFVASFPGPPSFRAIIPRMTFDPPEGKAEGGSKVIRGIIAWKEGEPGNEATHLYVAKETCGTRCL